MENAIRFPSFFQIDAKGRNVFFATNGRLWLGRDGEAFLAHARLLRERKSGTES